MPTFACPKCKKVLKTSNPIPAGKNIKCPACSQVFPVPAEASAEKTAVQANKPVAAARKAAASAPPVEAAKRSRPDADAREQRDRLSARKAKARAETDDPDDEEEEEDRPARRRKKKKDGSQQRLVLILSGVGVLLLLLVVAAFVWPGFLKSGPVKAVNNKPIANRSQPGGPKDPLAFVPTPIDLLMGADLAFLRNKPDVSRQLLDVARQKGATAEQIDLVKNVDRGIFAIGGLGQRVRTLTAFSTLNPVDPEQVRAAFQAGPPEMMQGKAVYTITAPDNQGKEFLAIPYEKTIVVGSMPQADFSKLLEGNGKLAPDMEAEVNALSQKTLWAVLNLQVVLKEKAKEVDSLKTMPGGEQAVPAIKNAKLVGFAVDWGNDARLQLDIHCANDQDATQVEAFAKVLWEKNGKPYLSMAPLLLGKQADGDGIKLVVNEISNGVQIQRQGAKVSASLTVSEASLKTFEKLLASTGNNPQPMNPKAISPKNRKRPNVNKKGN